MTALTPPRLARCKAPAPGLSETTSTIEGPTNGSSRSAWRFVPAPEASTATRASTSGHGRRPGAEVSIAGRLRTGIDGYGRYPRAIGQEGRVMKIGVLGTGWVGK